MEHQFQPPCFKIKSHRVKFKIKLVDLLHIIFTLTTLTSLETLNSKDSMTKAIFWDNDGVLVDTEKLYFEATRQVFALYEVVLTEEMFIDNFLKRSRGAWHLLENRIKKTETVDELRIKRNAIYKKLIETNLELIPGIEQSLISLSGLFRMAVVTSSRKEHFEAIHKQTGFLKYFEFVLTREDYTNSKPDPEPYNLARKITGLQREECLIVEDSERGLKSSLAAGIPAIIIPTELTRQSDFRGAKKILNSSAELIDYLLEEHSG